jgi:hypothetical protein
LKITIFNGKIHYKSPFSIAMLNYQRVCGSENMIAKVQNEIAWLSDENDGC